MGKVGRCVCLAYRLRLPIVHKFWEPQPSEALRICRGPYRDFFTFTGDVGRAAFEHQHRDRNRKGTTSVMIACVCHFPC